MRAAFAVWRGAPAAGADAWPPSPLAGATASAGITLALAFSICSVTLAPAARPGSQRNSGVRSKGLGCIHCGKLVFFQTGSGKSERTSPAMLAPQDAEPDAAAVRIAVMYDQAQAPQVGPGISA